MVETLFFLSMCVVVYYAGLSVWYTVLLIASFPEVIKKFQEATYGNIITQINQDNLIPITIATPAYNEEKRIVNMIYGIFNSDYKNVKLIIVNDGSTDGTMALLKKEFELYETPLIIKQTIKTSKINHCYLSKTFPNLMVLDKEHSPYHCAADSVNAGLNACETPIFLTIDADTLLEPEALSRMLFTFLSRSHCVVVSGSVYVLNENKVEQGRVLTTNLPRRFVSAVQSVEYLRSFLYGRAGINVFGGALSYPGAFTLFETEGLREVGGFDTKNFAYDAEIITKIHHYMRQHKYPHNLNHSPNAFCWTEVPSTLKSYWYQRDHWQRGMLRGTFNHFGMFFNPKYGVVGLLTFPTYFFFDVLGPLVEFSSVVLFTIAYFINQLNYQIFLWFILLAWGFITYITVAMVFLNLISFNKYNKLSDVFRTIWLVFAEMLWFRQYRALCCSIATVRFLIYRLLGRPH